MCGNWKLYYNMITGCYKEPYLACVIYKTVNLLSETEKRIYLFSTFKIMPICCVSCHSTTNWLKWEFCTTWICHSIVHLTNAPNASKWRHKIVDTSIVVADNPHIFWWFSCICALKLMTKAIPLLCRQSVFNLFNNRWEVIFKQPDTIN